MSGTYLRASSPVHSPIQPNWGARTDRVTVQSSLSSLIEFPVGAAVRHAMQAHVNKRRLDTSLLLPYVPKPEVLG